MSLLNLDELKLSQLRGAVLNTYSPTGRARNLEFTIADVAEEGITFRKQNGKEQTARRKEVLYIRDNWEACKAGEISRQELAKKSFNTSYLFAVFHCIDNLSK
jgi:hypothetical protein